MCCLRQPRSQILKELSSHKTRKIGPVGCESSLLRYAKQLKVSEWQ